MSDLLKIRTLTERFLEGETTLAEERELYEYYRRDDLPDDLLALRPMFMGLDAVSLQDEENGETAALPQPEHRQMKPRWNRWLLVAASLLVLLVMGGALLWNDQQNECVAYIYGKKCTDQKVVLQELQRTISDVTNGDEWVVENQLNDLFGIN
ncbi:MAG: hypothetical protein IJ604_13885 [Prevotella sp.]|nr:hypothetical protein [Prevotella sp.]